MMQPKTDTPMMQQYFRIKKEHPDSLLFYRMGDFYEMFFEDAKAAAPVLEIALTSRQKIPMCGVPYHAADAYLVKLLRHGFKVAVCEQVEDPKKAKGVVKREVIKILTPGTAVELDLDESKLNTFITSLCVQEEGWGFAVLDLASGRLNSVQSELGENRVLADEVFKTSPKEIIFPESQEQTVRNILSRNGMTAVLRSPQEDWLFDNSHARNVLLDHFKVRSLAGFGLEEKPLAVSAAGALLFYLKSLRRDSLSLVHSLSYVQASRHMVLDASTINNLELVRNLRDGKVGGSLLDVIDYTSTSMGGRLLRSTLLQPLLDVGEIEEKQEAVSEFLIKTIERQELKECLKDILDLERLTGRISLAVAHARDLISLKRSLQPLPKVKDLLAGFESGMIAGIRDDWDDGSDIEERIEKTLLDEPAFLLTEGGLIKSGNNAELDELREISRSGKGFISQLEKKEKERTGIASLKVKYNKVFGYFIDVTKPNLHLVPEDYIRKQTLINSERFITPELKDYEEKVLKAEQRIGELEYTLFSEVRDWIAEKTVRLQKIARDVAHLDLLASLAELASRRNYNRPVVSDVEGIKIIGGRHPVVELTAEEPFIPNDTFLNRGEDQILIITGPNMGGKSTYLRQVALICILAQMGSFVPSDEAEIGVVDRIFTRIGAMDFLTVGQSTFMVEMLETANILNNVTPRSLILLDEVGRGTSTFDGLSIAWAVAEHLHEQDSVRAKTLFATHYHELTELALTMGRIKNCHVAVMERQDEITFLRKILPGPSDRSYGIHVAKLAGIPRPVINRAKEILFNLERQEFDEVGLPKIAYHSSVKRDRSQLLLFQQDREIEDLRALKEDLETVELSSLTPLEALNLLHSLQEKASGKRS